MESLPQQEYGGSAAQKALQFGAKYEKKVNNASSNKKRIKRVQCSRRCEAVRKIMDSNADRECVVPSGRYTLKANPSSTRLKGVLKRWVGPSLARIGLMNA